MESDTPRTDAENYIYDIGLARWVSIEFARQLERELAAAIKQRDAARELNKEWQQKAATWLATPEAVARLQSYRDLGQQAAKAQNESDALRAELAAERATTASLLRTIALIREAGGFTREDLAALPGAVEAMREQRDEARRWYCRLIAYQRQDRGEDFDPESVAVEEGWDCFKGGGA